jgi:FkbM family methyltransferase
VATVYAQNFEDVILWRALGNINSGHYVDVGAHDPDYSSVTRRFYEAGWRGINVEPVATMFEKLVARRPEDVNVRVACSDHEHEMTLYEVVDTGLSTVDPAHASELRANGWNVQETAVHVVTLDSLLEKYDVGPIHFLKVDVEGWESAVLAGCDLKRWRPWVLVIEATAPLSRDLTSAGWEPGILDAGYQQVYFDGLNNYYVADEHAELAADFGLQPNVFDGFALAPDHCLVDQTQRLALLQEIERLRGLVTQTEELARSCEDWARTSEAQLLEYQDYAAHAIKKARKAAENSRRSIGSQLAQPLRTGSSLIRRVGVSAVKSAVRPALDLGLNLVRRNEEVKNRLRQVLHRVPAVEARLRKYADARPSSRDAV